MEKLLLSSKPEGQSLREGELLAILGSDDQKRISELLNIHGERILPFVETTLRRLLPMKAFGKIEVLTAFCHTQRLHSIFVTAYRVIAQKQLHPGASFGKIDPSKIIKILEGEKGHFESLKSFSCVTVIQEGIRFLEEQQGASRELQSILGGSVAHNRSYRELPPFVPGKILSPVPMRASTPSLNILEQLAQEEKKY